MNPKRTSRDLPPLTPTECAAVAAGVALWRDLDLRVPVVAATEPTKEEN